MRIGTLGEFRFIERVKKRFPKQSNAVLSIGDDCAVLGFTRGRYLLVTSDMLIQDVHFDLKKVSPSRVGRKALAASLSDIAAMAGIPKYYVVSLAVPAGMPVAFLDDFYSGMIKLAKEYGVELIGGDTNRADVFICDITVIGETEKRSLARRDGAKTGDDIFVTGSLGGSIKGKQYDFTPRLREARILVRDFRIHSMIDISDGLASDLCHITDASGVGAVIYEARLPVSRDADSKYGALSDGEDYELLFTLPPGSDDTVLNRKLGLPVTKIGKVVQRRRGVKIVTSEGKKRRLEKSGFRHF